MYLMYLGYFVKALVAYIYIYKQIVAHTPGVACTLDKLRQGCANELVGQLPSVVLPSGLTNCFLPQLGMAVLTQVLLYYTERNG